MKFDIIANLYGSRAESGKLSKMMNDLDKIKIQNNFADKLKDEE